MPDLTQQFSCDIEAYGSKPAHLAHLPKQTVITDEVRPPRPNERGANDQSRDTLCVAIAAIIIAMIALAVILGAAYHQGESNGIPNATSKLSSATALQIAAMLSDSLKPRPLSWPCGAGRPER
jgi:predicted anti-sigma-YlaC factor YlaD